MPYRVQEARAIADRAGQRIDPADVAIGKELIEVEVGVESILAVVFVGAHHRQRGKVFGEQSEPYRSSPHPFRGSGSQAAMKMGFRRQPKS